MRRTGGGQAARVGCPTLRATLRPSCPPASLLRSERNKFLMEERRATPCSHAASDSAGGEGAGARSLHSRHCPMISLRQSAGPAG